MKHFLLTGGNGFIGTNLVEELRTYTQPGDKIFITDIQPPKIPLLANEEWLQLDLLDRSAVFSIFERTRPDVVVHMAAQTACLPHMVMDDYLINTKGSENIFEACEQFETGFLVHTSTQFVHQAVNMPVSDMDYAPHTVYGESKAISEKLLRESRFTFNWTIIRPTNIWGPWHIRYPFEFWKVVKQGKYFHPGRKKVMRSYGYVGNVCAQIIEIIRRQDDPAVSRQVFYVGDLPVNLYEWVNDFSLAITHKPAKVIPGFFIYFLAVAGSALQKARVRFPITLSRYKSMTTENPAPMEKTFRVLQTAPYSQKEGVQVTVEWLNEFWKKQETAVGDSH